jgi:murein DD-endopeptidase MepM/ murein hydrolase activator NlpD
MARSAGRHRRPRRGLSLPAAAGAAAVTVALAGSLSMATAGASGPAPGSSLALDTPARPATTGQAADAGVFDGLESAAQSLVDVTTTASSSTHSSIRAEEVKKKKQRERRLAAQRAAREAAERERLARLYTKPLSSYRVSAQYGVRGWAWSRGYHTGLDLTAAYGTPVKAVHSGKVTVAGWDGAYGYKVEITHSDGTQTWYAHMSRLAVSGGSVSTGQTIGHVGSTGNSYGNHLHLEVHAPGGGELNPYTWLQDKGVTL